MRILLATGIYPPDIGGPATYVKHLKEEMETLGHEVTVVTYGEKSEERNTKYEIRNTKAEKKFNDQHSKHPGEVIVVSKAGGPLLRWWRYAQVLRQMGSDADIIYAFSSVSCGVPLWLAHLRRPRNILRLGGDFFWERYTDWGGKKTLREWYESWWFWATPLRSMAGWLLHRFDYLIFSTHFQQEIYQKHYPALPKHCVIENALPLTAGDKRQATSGQQIQRLLFMGRFVGFKNLFALITAMQSLPTCTLSLVGDGFLAARLQAHACSLGLKDRVRFLPPVHGPEKVECFAAHDLLVLPSLTEISPNVALEAAAQGLPVLLTSEQGLSGDLLQGIKTTTLRIPGQISAAVQAFFSNQPNFSWNASSTAPHREWSQVALEHELMLQRFLTESCPATAWAAEDPGGAQK